MKKTLKERAEYTMSIIIRNALAVSNEVNPIDITEEQVKQCMESGEVGGYDIMISDPFPSRINYQTINCALVSKKTGYWYYTTTLTTEGQD